MIPTIATETKLRIARLARMMETCTTNEPKFDLKDFEMDQALAMRISELALDYMRLTIPRIRNEEMWNLFFADERLPERSGTIMLVGELYQLIPCIADINVNITLMKENAGIYKIYLAQLDKAIKFMESNMTHLLNNNTSAELLTEANTSLLTSIINSTLRDVHKAVTKMMYHIYADLADAEGDTEVDLKALAASCSEYMKTLGFAFVSREWYSIPEHMRADFKEIANWAAWTTINEDHVMFSPMYLSWYNPLNGRIDDVCLTTEI